jgi:voltage-gated potassium channel
MGAAPADDAYIMESTLVFKDRVRSPRDLRTLSEFERRIHLPLILSAILPIVTAATRAGADSGISIAINIVTWLVFVLDLAVHVRYVRGYLRSGMGLFDLGVVILTAPWFLIPGFEGSQILMLARLARLLRLLFVSKAARRAGNRLGKVGLFAAGMLLFCSWVAYAAEHPTNPEFSTYGNALWWGIVTLTTVGYGDIVPETEKGRVAGTFLMLTGIATLGLISATLASLFRLSPAGRTESEVPSPDAPAPSVEAPRPDLASELAAARQQLAAVEQQLAAVARAATPEQ